MTFEIGSIVTFEARNSRGQEGEGEILPAIVMKQHPDGSLQLWAFHFQGSNLVYSIRPEEVKLVIGPAPTAVEKKYNAFAEKFSFRDKS